MARPSSRLPTISAIIDDFSTAPFRLFFLSACPIGILAATVWAWAMIGGYLPITDPLYLHLFLFLQSLGGAVYAGFLFTAIPEWTHNPTPLTRKMQGLWLLWLSASTVAFCSLSWALSLMVLYWSIVLWLATSLVWQKRDDRHISVLLFIVATWICSIYLTIQTWQNKINLFDWQQLLHIEVMGIALISFRISRALGSQALEDAGQIDSRFIPNPFYKNLAVWLFYTLIISNLLLKNNAVEGWLNLAVAGVMIGRLREWHFLVLLKQHYVRWLYLTLLMIGIGYAWRGSALVLDNPHPILNPVLPLHWIAIGGLLMMIYQVFHIAGLRHSHCALIYPHISRMGLFLILLAAFSRSLAVALGGNYVWFAIYLPSLLISLALMIYIPVFYQIFIKNPASVPSED